MCEEKVQLILLKFSERRKNSDHSLAAKQIKDCNWLKCNKYHIKKD